MALLCCSNSTTTNLYTIRSTEWHRGCSTPVPIDVEHAVPTTSSAELESGVAGPQWHRNTGAAVVAVSPRHRTHLAWRRGRLELRIEGDDDVDDVCVNSAAAAALRPLLAAFGVVCASSSTCAICILCTKKIRFVSRFYARSSLCFVECVADAKLVGVYRHVVVVVVVVCCRGNYNSSACANTHARTPAPHAPLHSLNAFVAADDARDTKYPGR